MLPGNDYSGSRKLFICLTLVSLSVLLLAGISFGINELFYARKTLAISLVSTADLLAVSSSDAISDNDKQSARENLASPFVNPGIVAAVLYDRYGQIYDRYIRDGSDERDFITGLKPAYPDISSILGEIRVNGSFQAISDGYMHVISPVFVQDELFGFIHLVDDMRQVRGRMSRYLMFMVSIMFVILSMMVLFFKSLNKRFFLLYLN